MARRRKKPNGAARVPAKPTPQMVQAGIAEYETCRAIGDVDADWMVKAVYSAMIGAARVSTSR
jgi:hypothetical protein